MQPPSLSGKRVAVENSGNPWVLFTKGQHKAKDTKTLIHCIGVVADNAAHSGKNCFLDKFNQPFVHASFAGKVTIKRCFGYTQFCGQRSGGNTPTTGHLPHAR